MLGVLAIILGGAVAGSNKREYGFAALTVKETGFFEWEGAPETVAP